MEQQELQQRPYRGMQSFREDHKDLFFGRAKPIEDITGLVRNNLLTVIFGKSGIGKSSLINAGLVPKLREDFFLPIVIRIPFADPLVDPLLFVKTRIETEIKKYIRKDLIYPTNTTLWQFFRDTNYTGGAIIPVLIFDQFEEYFRFMKSHSSSSSFIKELSDLIENRLPNSVSDEARKIIKIADAQNVFKVVISLREDFLAPLEDLSAEIPSLNKVRYRILQLQGQEAFEAVYLPAKHLIDEKTTIQLLEKIIPPKPTNSTGTDTGKDTNQSRWQYTAFEPYILSLFCYQVNEKRIDAGQDKILENLINQTKVETILSDYYTFSLAKYRRRYHKNFSPVLEKNLLSEEGYRLLKPATAKELNDLPPQAINDLINDRILHKENRNDISYIEVSHDLLAKVIYDRKIARHNKNTSYKLAGVVLVVFVIIFLLSYNIQQQQNYKALQTIVDSLNRQKAVSAEDSARIQSLNTKVADLVTGGDTSNADLVTPVQSSNDNTKVYFQVNDINAKEQSLACGEALRRLNFKIPPDKPGLVDVEVKRMAFSNNIKYFNKTDEANSTLIKSICDRYYSTPFTLIPMVDTRYAGNRPIEIWANYDPWYLQLFIGTASIRKSAAQFMIRNYRTVDTLKQWPGKLIETARKNRSNRSGVFNTLYVLNRMDKDYLYRDKTAIYAWLDEVERNAGPSTTELIGELRKHL